MTSLEGTSSGENRAWRPPHNRGVLLSKEHNFAATAVVYYNIKSSCPKLDDFCGPATPVGLGTGILN